MQIVERLLCEHRTIRELADAFAALLREPALADQTAVADARWAMTKMLMQHVAYEDCALCLPLERDPRPHAVAVAKRFKDELNAIQASFETHMARWSTGATAANWQEYRTISLRQIDALTDRLRREEAELFPLAAGNAEIEAGSPDSQPQRNWARSAWAVQDSLKR